MTKSPARKLVLPKHLRAVDRTTLSWRQLRLVLASVALRDRILLTLDMTETFRPSELFALRGAASTWDARYAHRKADCLQGRAARLRARPRNR